MIWWIAGCAVIALLLYVGVTFNELVAERNQVRAAWADIDVQLQRRHDLVPQLAATVKGYAEHERSTLSAVTELRTLGLHRMRDSVVGPRVLLRRLRELMDEIAGRSAGGSVRARAGGLA